jgi:hemerythrin superfamily protein
MPEKTRDPELDSDVVMLLMAQHSQIRDLFAEVKHARGQDKRDAFERLVRLLAAHETAEAEVVHPLSRRAPGGDGVVEDRLSEEREAKEKLQRLERISPDWDGFDPLLDELRHEVLEHARAEERYEFMQLRHQAGPERLSALATMVRAAEAAPTHPHPGVESATANLAVSPVVVVADRIRDATREASR